MTDKKSYNPFKMWGSWIGLVIGIIVSFSVLFKIPIIVFYLHPLMWFLVDCNDLGCIPALMITTPIFYFLIGWAIHSLFRRFRK